MVFEGVVGHLILTFSYIGVFIANVIVSSSFIIPLPGPLIIVVAAAGNLNIILVSIASASGSMVGEMTGYYAGFLGNKVAQRTIRKYIKIEKFIRKHFNRYAVPLIFLTALLPFPFDLVGFVAGATRYSIVKFFVSGFFGKFLKTVYFYIAFKYGLVFILRLAGWG